MQAILLAAGMGTRLLRLTEELPKTLLELHGKKILDCILGSLEVDGIDEIVVVGGFRFGILQEHLSSYNRKPIRLVENTNYKHGSILTIEKALPHIRGGFILLNADHIHPQEMISDLIADVKDMTCACDFDRQLTDDDMKVKLLEGRVARMDKKLTDYDCGYIGMTACPANKLDLYRDYVTKTKDREGIEANVEKVVHLLALEGHNPLIHDCSGFGWVEVDTPEDLELAKELIRENKYLKKL